MKLLLLTYAGLALPFLSASGGEIRAADLNPSTPEGLGAFSARPQVKIDTDPRAKGNGEGLVLYAPPTKLAALKRDYDPKSFDLWVEKLKTVQPGMTPDEVKAAIPARKAEIVVALGAGIIFSFELDDAYFVHGLFNYDSKLLNINRHPIAITYDEPVRIKATPVKD